MENWYKYLTALIVMSFVATLCMAQRPHFVYDVDFEFRFDNREYDASSYSKSMTIFGARVSPVVGLGISSRNGLSSHALMAGADVLKDFGSPDIKAGMLLYYKWDRRFRKTDVTMTAGIFPRRMMQGEYSTAFFSDSLKFYDSSLEGLLLTFRRPRSFYEIGCDWMGKYGENTRERFMIFGSGYGYLTKFFRLGLSAYMYHYAGSENVTGVVDNILVNPYAAFELGRLTGLQRLSFSLGYLQSMQNDRRNVGNYVFPGGGEFVFSIRNWNVGIENRLFYGAGMMPYYDSTDAAGVKYGNSLYFGDAFYRVRINGGNGIYDRLEVFYAPYIAPFVQLKVAAVCHFNEGFSGWQQIVSINVDLNDRTFKRRR